MIDITLVTTTQLTSYSDYAVETTLPDKGLHSQITRSNIFFMITSLMNVHCMFMFVLWIFINFWHQNDVSNS